jgi:hypothetical protein
MEANSFDKWIVVTQYFGSMTASLLDDGRTAVCLFGVRAPSLETVFYLDSKDSPQMFEER